MSLIEEVREFRSFIEKMAESVDDETAKSLIDNNVWEPSESVPTLWEEYVADNIE